MSYFEKITSEFDSQNTSAFNTLEVGELSYVFQGDFVYGLNPQLWNTAVISGTGATVDTSSSRLRIQSGTNSAGYAYIQGRKTIRYRAGQGTNARFTPVFTTGVANNIQLWGIGSVVSNLPYDGWFFGYNGTTFGIAYYNGGSVTWTAQGSWNGDHLDGTGPSGITWNPTNGTPVMIKYPYLGYGDVFFYVQNPLVGGWILAHIIRYANTSNNTELTNPTLQFMGFTLNSGNTTNQTMYCGSVGIAISGLRNFASNPKWSVDNNKSGITTETCLINIQNCTTYNGVANRALLRLNTLSGLGTSGGSNVSIFRLKTGVTIGGSPSWTAVNGTESVGGTVVTGGNSVATIDTAGTTVLGGNYIWNISTFNSSSGFVVDLTPFEIYIAPGEILTVSGFSTASASQYVSINWSEDI